MIEQLPCIDIPPSCVIKSETSDSQKVVSNSSFDVSFPCENDYCANDRLTISTVPRPSMENHINLTEIQKLLDRKLEKHTDELKKSIRQSVFEPH